MVDRLPPDIAAKVNARDQSSRPSDARVGLMIDLARSMVDLSPPGFGALLDRVVALAEFNEQVNPA
jgi:hypothetical protein